MGNKTANIVGDMGAGPENSAKKDMVKKDPVNNDLVNAVDKSGEFWHEYVRELAAIRARFTGREAEYLDLVKPVLQRSVEAVRAVLLRETGLDLKTGTQASPPPDLAAVVRRRAWWENVERYGRDCIKIGQAVSLTMEAARQNGKDPVLEGYAMFFWAMENVPAAGTVFLMLDTEGGEKEHTALLTAGWADAHVSLQGQHAGRLRAALLAQGGDLRRQLRQELPGAVLEAAQEWRPGRELPVGERAQPRPGKTTAGRQKRTLLSRITRLIERQGTSEAPSRTLSVQSEAERWQASATRQAAQGPQGDSGVPSMAGSEFGALWRDLVRRARLGPHEAQIASYVSAHPDCLDTRRDSRLRLRRGTQVELARVLGRPPDNVRREVFRMLGKLEKARIR